jgi:hypothetical protein
VVEVARRVEVRFGIDSVVLVRKVLVAGLLAILVTIGSGCGDQQAAPSSESIARGEVVAVPAPTGTQDDPLAGLPVTALKDVLASWPLADADSLVVTDLAAGRVDSFDDADTEALRGVTFAPDGSLVYVDGPSSLAVIGNDGQRRSIRVDGEIERIAIVEMIGQRIVVRPSIKSADNDRLVAGNTDGSSMCTGPAQPFGDITAGGWAWFDDLASKLDPVTCRSERGLDVTNDPADAAPLVSAVHVDGERVFVAGDASVSRFDLDSGRLEATTKEPLPLVMDMAVRDQEVWVLHADELAALDADTLEMERRVKLDVCEGTASFVETSTSVYVLDDCAGTLTLLDDTSGDPVKAWELPSDGMSDSMTGPVVAGPNIWMVNREQSAEPFVFNAETGRFERLPDEVRSEARQSTWYLAVKPALSPAPG